MRRATVVSDHFEIIDRMAERLRSEPYGAGEEASTPLLDRLPGLLQLFNSLASPSWTERFPGNRRLEEWNPLSQRVLLPDAALPRLSAMECDFNLVQAHTQTFVEWAHEAVHVLLLEPLLTGRMQLASPDGFKRLYTAGEAFAFWYADMVVTRVVRSLAPEAEFVYNRSAASNLTFHPEEAFRRLGLDDPEQVLRAYVRAFLDDAGPIVTGLDPYGKHLRNKIRDFYRDTSKAVVELHTLYLDFGVQEFLDRFCGQSDLPSLFTPEQLESAQRLPLEDYVVELGLRILPSMMTLDRERVERVALRRHIQTRAYHAWFLSKLLEKDWISTLRDVDLAAATKGLSRYLLRLEGALEQLRLGAAPASVRGRLRRADAGYDRTIREPQLEARGFVRRRAFLHPYFEPTDGVIGLADQALPLSRGRMVAVVRRLINKLDWGTAFEREGDHETLATIYTFLTLAKTADLQSVREAYNLVLTRPDVLPFWSVYIAAAQPSRNVFREFAFAFA